MSRYIEEEVIIKAIDESGQRYGITTANQWNFKEIVRKTPTADVVPKSEVEYLKEHLEMWCKKYQKAREEIEKLQSDIAQYQLDLHYSVCREDEAAERTASKIFDELEYLSMDGKIPMNGYYAELKKKYIGGSENE